MTSGIRDIFVHNLVIVRSLYFDVAAPDTDVCLAIENIFCFTLLGSVGNIWSLDIAAWNV